MGKTMVIPNDMIFSKAVRLRAGNLSALYEEGRIRYIRHGNTELVRGIYTALRLEDWSTLPATISDEELNIQELSFQITYTATYTTGKGGFRATFLIEGFEDDRIEYSMKGISLGMFMSRRIGICVLHPIETSSEKQVDIIHVDGSGSASVFPKYISPAILFCNVRGMKIHITDHHFVRLDFQGDIFETEDQRNWSDHSYKTYNSPADLPALFEVPEGFQTEQRVTIRLTGQSDMAREVAPFAQMKKGIPKIGIARARHQPVLPPETISVMKDISFDHYLFQVSLADPLWPEFVWNASKEAELLGTKLLLHVFFSSRTEEELNIFMVRLLPVQEHIGAILILSDAHSVVPVVFFTQAYHAIKAVMPQIRVGYGTAEDFAELNVSRPGDIPFDFVSFSSYPQVHQSDTRTIVENLDCHRCLVESAKQISYNKPVYISPVTLGKPDVPDTREGSRFYSWWILHSIAGFAGADSISLYNPAGAADFSNDVNPSFFLEVLKTLQDFAPEFAVKNGEEELAFVNKTGEQLVFAFGLKPEFK